MPDAADNILMVHVSYPNARLVPKVEFRICNHGEIAAQIYLKAPDKNHRWVLAKSTQISFTIMVL